QGGVLGQPSERVEALEHFRLVHGSEAAVASPFRRAIGQNQPRESWVKTFERVDGATIKGTGPANATVQTSVQMRIPTTNQTFFYNQFAETDENGNFEMVVPYSTTGYDNYGPENGHTNVSVRATGPYIFQAFPQDSIVAWTGQTEVTEGQVIGENQTAVTVELEGQEPGGANETQSQQRTVQTP
ncbi:MAG: asparagine N-glycosylation enzyme membrane subunit Stt3, partial [Natronomonas sp.]